MVDRRGSEASQGMTVRHQVQIIMPFHLWPDDHRSSRREFLGGIALGGIVLGLGGRAVAEEPAEGWFALLSDTHIAANPATIGRTQNMADNLKAVVADILANPTRPVGLLINGDLALRDGQPGDYATLLSLLAPIRDAKIPIHLTLGNHDDRGPFREAIKGTVPTDLAVENKYVSNVSALGYRFLLLDSLDRVNVVDGRLGTAQLDWLARELDRAKETPTLIVVHHNPYSSATPGLLDHAALLETAKTHPCVRAVVYGHTHTWANLESNGVRLVNLPPVGYAFGPGHPIGYTKFAVRDGRASVQLRAIAGETSKDGEISAISARPA
jgi:Icc protein